MSKELEALRAYFDSALADPRMTKALYKALLDERSQLVRSSWIASLANGNSNWQGELVPWFNYGVIRFLAGRVSRKMRVFEFGAGFSTLWWQRRVAAITAVEHDEQWAATVSGLVAPPTVVKHVPLDYDGHYCRTILETDDTYDIVIVDGRDRVNCMMQAKARL